LGGGGGGTEPCGNDAGHRGGLVGVELTTTGGGGTRATGAREAFHSRTASSAPAGTCASARSDPCPLEEVERVERGFSLTSSRNEGGRP